MAETDFGALSTSQKKVWSARVLKAGRDQSFLFTNGMIGEGTEDNGKPIHRINELTQDERGDRCVIPLVLDMTGDGRVGDDQLEGYEESLVNDDLTITVDQLRHAVKNKGRMSEQRTVIRFRAQARDKIAFWLADKIDELGFLTLAGIAYTSKLDGSTRPGSSRIPSLAFAADVAAPTSGRLTWAGSATSNATLTSNDTMSWDLLVKANTLAKRKKLKPIRMNGRSYYVVLMTPEQGRSLKGDSNYRTTLQQAGERGANNPLFTGAFAVVDGLILYEHNKVPSTFGIASGSKWGSGGTLDGCHAILMGAQALGLAMIGEPSWDESDNTDYGNKKGIAYGRMIGMRKTVFKSLEDNSTSQDFSTVIVRTVATAIA